MEMEGELMKDSRKDSKGRVLKDGESQRKDGSYEYKGADGRRHSVCWNVKGTSGEAETGREKRGGWNPFCKSEHPFK